MGLYPPPVCRGAVEVTDDVTEGKRGTVLDPRVHCVGHRNSGIQTRGRPTDDHSWREKGFWRDEVISTG